MSLLYSTVFVTTLLGMVLPVFASAMPVTPGQTVTFDNANANNDIIAATRSDAEPTPPGTAPPTLDFSSPVSRDFLTTAPKLRQTCFVGDGRRDNGEGQRYVGEF